MTTPLTISNIADAIEKNGVPQIRGQYKKTRGDNFDEVIGACAIGQASINLNRGSLAIHNWLDDRPKLVACPENCNNPFPEYRMHLGSTVTHLNDVHFWSLKKIADWLREQA